jgi:SHS2 domain-containing protein
VGNDLPHLLKEGGRSLFFLLLQNPEKVEEKNEETLEIEEREIPFLVFDFLNEIFLKFTTEKKVYKTFLPEVEHLPPLWKVSCTLRGERWDPDRNPPRYDLKAITYHRFSVEKKGDRWELIYYVDL